MVNMFWFPGKYHASAILLDVISIGMCIPSIIIPSWAKYRTQPPDKPDANVGILVTCFPSFNTCNSTTEYLETISGEDTDFINQTYLLDGIGISLIVASLFVLLVTYIRSLSRNVFFHLVLVLATATQLAGPILILSGIIVFGTTIRRYKTLDTDVTDVVLFDLDWGFSLTCTSAVLGILSFFCFVHSMRKEWLVPPTHRQYRKEFVI